MRVIYGRKPIFELLKHRPADVKELLIGDNVKFEPELEQLVSKAQSKGLKVRQVGRQELAEITEATNSQGLAARVSDKSFVSLDQLIAKGKKENETGLIVVLDQLSDPQNYGAVLRVCESAGVLGVIVTEDRSSPLSATVVKASAGASEFLDVCQVTNLQRTLKKLKDEGFWIAGSTLSEKSRSVYETVLPFPLVLILGSEGKGIRRLTEKECDILVNIPMCGKVQSLNVSQAGAILLYEILRRNLELKKSKEKNGK
jgi:23S rRNA (guanosine2251-2'-O)-methyltransferase